MTLFVITMNSYVIIMVFQMQVLRYSVISSYSWLNLEQKCLFAITTIVIAIVSSLRKIASLRSSLGMQMKKESEQMSWMMLQLMKKAARIANWKLYYS